MHKSPKPTVWGPGLEICISENSLGSSSVQSDWDWIINQLDICPKKNKVRKKNAPHSPKSGLCLFSSLSLLSVAASPLWLPHLSSFFRLKFQASANITPVFPMPPPPPVSFKRPPPFRANFIRVTAKYPSPYFQMTFMLQAKYTQRHTCPVCGSLQNEFHE